MTYQAPVNDILSALKAARIFDAAMINGVGALEAPSAPSRTMPARSDGRLIR
jgi:hypothetical protein